MSTRKPKTGLFLIGSPRFRKLGADTASGSYDARKHLEAQAHIAVLSPVTDLVYDGIVYTRADASAAITHFQEESVDCALAIFLSWAEDAPWIDLLTAYDGPLLYASVVRPEIPISDTHDPSEFVDFLSFGSLVGFLEGSGSLRRNASSMHLIHLGSEDSLIKMVSIFANAARVRSELSHSSVALLGSYNEAMWATYADPYNVFRTFRAQLHFLSVAELAETVAQIPAEQVARTVAALSARYPVEPDVDPEKFAASVRASIAMEQLAHQNAVQLLVLNDIDPVLFRQIGLRPGFSPTDGSDALTIVPEGDIGGGLAAYILHLLTGQRVNFLEPFYIYGDRDAFSAGHAGPNDPTQCPENVIISRDTRFAQTSYRYAGAPFMWYVFPSGVKTMLHMSECGGRWKMVAAPVECLPTHHTLASYSHADFRPIGQTCVELFQKIAECGVTQHFAITDGNCIPALRVLAQLLSIDFHDLTPNQSSTIQ